MGLRVRKKKNASGSVSIHIVDRSNRGYKVVESVGSSKDENKIEELYSKALQRIDELENNLLHTAKIDEEQRKLEELFSQITTQDITSQGDELIFGRLFDAIGCVLLDRKNITKSDLKLSYYAKYLDIDDKCTIKYRLNPDKVKLDAKLDGIKGFATNDFALNPEDVIAHYQNQYRKRCRSNSTSSKLKGTLNRSPRF